MSDIESKNQMTRREALGLSALTVVGLGSFGVIATRAVLDHEERQRTFFALLKDNPLTGEIALATDNKIMILRASDLTNGTDPIQTFQVPHKVLHLKWLSESELVFTSRAHDFNSQAQHQLTEDDGSLSVVSHGVFKLNRESGEISTLFDPYSEGASAVLGDIQGKDARKADELHSEWNKEPGENTRVQIRIIQGDYSALQIERIGTTAASEVYFQAKGDWFAVHPNGGGISRPVRIPQIDAEQLTSSDDLFKLTDSGGFYLTDGHATGLLISKDAQCAAWRAREL